MEEQKDISRLDILNKRDEFFSFISNESNSFKEFLSTKSNKKWDLNSSMLEDVYQKFLNLSKPSLEKIRDLRKITAEKRSDIINDIKIYSNFLLTGSEEDIKSNFAELTIQYEKELAEIKDKLSEVFAEKETIVNKKIEYDNITRQKIEEIRSKITNEHSKVNITVEHENIKSLVGEHRKFIETEIQSKLNDINLKFKNYNEQIKAKEEAHISNTYLILEKKRASNKEEFLVLVGIEKDVILKALKFQDFLEDVENFYNDQITLYNILFKTKRIIKLNKANQIFRDSNEIFVDMATSERIFDSINKESLRSKYLIDGKKTETLKAIQENLIGSSKNSSNTLLDMVQTSASKKAKDIEKSDDSIKKNDYKFEGGR